MNEMISYSRMNSTLLKLNGFRSGKDYHHSIDAKNMDLNHQIGIGNTRLSLALLACLRSRSRSCFISGGSSSSAELTNGGTLRKNVEKI